MGRKAVPCALLLALLACTTPTHPQVHLKGPISGVEGSGLFLVAPRQKERIARSLHEAGIELVDDLVAAPLYLRATLGNEKGFRGCGTFNNVKYSLRHKGQEIAFVSASGWTGECEPNVFDGMSSALKAVLAGER